MQRFRLQRGIMAWHMQNMVAQGCSRARRQFEQAQRLLHLLNEPGVAQQAGHHGAGLIAAGIGAGHWPGDGAGPWLAAAIAWLALGEEAVEQGAAVFRAQRLVLDPGRSLGEALAKTRPFLRRGQAAALGQQGVKRLGERLSGAQHRLEGALALLADEGVGVLARW